MVKINNHDMVGLSFTDQSFSHHQAVDRTEGGTTIHGRMVITISEVGSNGLFLASGLSRPICSESG
jgi:hypothetical protein